MTTPENHRPFGESDLKLDSSGKPDGLNVVRTYNPVQLFFLLRLSRMLMQRGAAMGEVSPDNWRMRLLNKALYSTYRDCEELGLRDEAQTLLQQPDSPESKQSS